MEGDLEDGLGVLLQDTTCRIGKLSYSICLTVPADSPRIRLDHLPLLQNTNQPPHPSHTLPTLTKHLQNRSPHDRHSNIKDQHLDLEGVRQGDGVVRWAENRTNVEVHGVDLGEVEGDILAGGGVGDDFFVFFDGWMM